MVMKLGELETPYMKGSTFYNKHSIKCIGIKDREGFDAFDCYADDADEILKRINGYEQLQATNKQLLSALENVTYYIETDDMKFLDMNKVREAITNAKQVMGDSDGRSNYTIWCCSR